MKDKKEEMSNLYEYNYQLHSTIIYITCYIFFLSYIQLKDWKREFDISVMDVGKCQQEQWNVSSLFKIQIHESLYALYNRICAIIFICFSHLCIKGKIQIKFRQLAVLMLARQNIFFCVLYGYERSQHYKKKIHDTTRVSGLSTSNFFLQ